MERAIHLCGLYQQYTPLFSFPVSLILYRATGESKEERKGRLVSMAVTTSGTWLKEMVTLQIPKLLCHPQEIKNKIVGGLSRIARDILITT